MKTLLIILTLIACSCSMQRKTVQKPYIAVVVQPELTGTYYEFINFNYTHGRCFLLRDTAQCKAGDTIVIKDYKHNFFSKKRTLFIKHGSAN